MNYGFAGLYGQPYGLTREEREALWKEDEIAGVVRLTEQNVPSQEEQAARESLSPTERGRVYSTSTTTAKQREIDTAWVRLSSAQRAELNALAERYAPKDKRPSTATAAAPYLLKQLVDGTVPLPGLYFGWLSAVYATQTGVIATLGAEWRKRQGLPALGSSASTQAVVTDSGGGVSPVLVGAGLLLAVGAGVYFLRG